MDQQETGVAGKKLLVLRPRLGLSDEKLGMGRVNGGVKSAACETYGLEVVEAQKFSDAEMQFGWEGEDGCHYHPKSKVL